MIVSLTPWTDFAPVPRVEVRVESTLVFDGGGPSTTGAPLLDGGTPSLTGEAYEGGNPASLLVDVPEGTDRVTLWRRCAGRAMKVRGAVDRPFSDSFGLLDFEAGFDTTSTYELECFGGDLPLGRVTLGSTVLDGPVDKFVTVVQQPLDPSLHAVVEETDVHAPTVERVAPGASVAVAGRSYPTLVSGGPRGGVTGVELVFAAKNRATAARVWATLGDEGRPQLPVWLVRSRHPLLPPVFFTDAFSLRESGVDLHVGGSESVFELTANEVAPPAPALVVPSLTYTDLAAIFPTYTELAAALPTYSGWASAWEYAGAAGIED